MKAILASFARDSSRERYRTICSELSIVINQHFDGLSMLLLLVLWVAIRRRTRWVRSEGLDKALGFLSMFF